MSFPKQIIDLAAQAVENLPEQHKSGALADLIATLVSQRQELETAIFEVLNQFDLDTATGNSLDNIGKIIGLRRQDGLTDTRFRAFIKAKIAANNSESTAEDILNVATLTIDDASYEMNFKDTPPTHYELNITGPGLSDVDVIYYLGVGIRSATAAGVGASIYYNEGPDSNAFKFDTIGNGFDQGTSFSTSLGV